jgi:ubiquinone/menaquinone biosynthesis C-methylase UbiE
VNTPGGILCRDVTPALSAQEIRDVNTRYHDVAAEHYDSKWGIDFGEIGSLQVIVKLRKALGQTPTPFARTLEIGSGTGYFTLNMMRAGLIDRATCTDISPGMLATLQCNAKQLGLGVQTQLADAEALPFAEQSFDLVFGHAVLHHIPDLPRAFGEFARVLAPGGMVMFAGEPSRYGDRLARVPKRLAGTLAPLWRSVLRARAVSEAEQQNSDASLEGLVDVHAFAPGELSSFTQAAGFEQVRVVGEELLANWFGWANRTLEATAEPEDVPWAWRQYAYRGYLALQKVDVALLESRLPPAIFYNLMIAARKPY